jgi:primosomal protein N'
MASSKRERCRNCGDSIDWGVLCDRCADHAEALRMNAPADASRCHYCGADKRSTAHAVQRCKREQDRVDAFFGGAR